MPRSVKYGIHVSNTGLNELIDALHLFSKPNHLATLPLELVLAAGFAATQAHVHVISGRLKASGRTSSHFDGNTWEGAVEYGGPRESPAYYGIFELARGGTHDFLAPMDDLDSKFGDAFSEWFLRTLG